MMPKFLRVVKLEDARGRLERYWNPQPRGVEIPLTEAAGRVLAEDVFSKIDVPPFDRAMYDGYAARAADTFGSDEDSPVVLKCVGRLRAGTWPRMRVRAKRCLEIATGAPIPPGADAVVMAERTTMEGKSVSVFRAVAPGENITKRGSDIKRGERIAWVGKRLWPTEIGLLSGAGIGRVKVYEKPRVAIVSSGEELLKPGDRLEPGKIYDINGPALCGAVRGCGAIPIHLGIVPDDVRAIRKVLKRGLGGCDVVMISGGTSAGTGDVSLAVIERMGKPGVIFHGLALKPGKPTFAAVVEGKPIFGLPGYPFSALMIFDLLIAPYLRRLSGLSQLEPSRIRAKLGSKILSARGRRELVPVKLFRKEMEFFAEPILKGSGAITSLSFANGYVDVPREQEIIEEGEYVEAILFEGVTVG